MLFLTYQKYKPLWDDTNLTGRLKKSELNGIFDLNGTTKKINLALTRRLWKDIRLRNISGIYKIINRLNGKYYVGSACNLMDRAYRHFLEMSSNRHNNAALQRACNKYGIENFEFKVVEQWPKETLKEREQIYLDIANEERKRVYNFAFNAERPTLGIKASPEILQKMAAAAKMRWLNPEFRKKHAEAVKNRVLPEESRKRMSESKKKPVNLNVYEFININTGESFCGVLFDFKKRYPTVPNQSIGAVANKRILLSNGWTLKSRKLEALKATEKERIIYEFYNLKTKESFCGNKFDLKKRAPDLKAGRISALLRGSATSCNNWTLKERLKDFNGHPFKTARNKTIHTFYNLITKETFVGTMHTLVYTYVLSSQSVSQVISRRMFHINFWIRKDRLNEALDLKTRMGRWMDKKIKEYVSKIN